MPDYTLKKGERNNQPIFEDDADDQKTFRAVFLADPATGAPVTPGTGSGDATALNQATQILAEERIRDAAELIDDVVHAPNGALDKAAAIAGQLDDTATTVATEGNVSPARITAQRALHANLRKNDGTEIGTAANPVVVEGDAAGTPLPVSGTVAVSTALALEATLGDVKTAVEALATSVDTAGLTQVQLDNIKTAVEAVAAALAAAGATNVQLADIVTATEAAQTALETAGGLLVNLGTNNDVAVTAVTPGTAAGNLGKARDSAPGATDTGVGILALREDALILTAAGIAEEDGDYALLRVGPNGALYVASIEEVAQKAYKGKVYDIEHVFKDIVAADTPLVAAPGASKAIVYLKSFIINQSAVVTEARLRDDDGTAANISANIDIPVDGGGGHGWEGPIECGTNHALDLLCAGGTYDIGIDVWYLTVDV